MKKKQTIQVRDYHGASHYYSNKFSVVETIRRVPWAEQIGNFNPVFCRYKGQRVLVHSDAGDLSDPFRRDESYGNSLFIVTKPKSV